MLSPLCLLCVVAVVLPGVLCCLLCVVAVVLPGVLCCFLCVVAVVLPGVPCAVCVPMVHMYVCLQLGCELEYCGVPVL